MARSMRLKSQPVSVIRRIGVLAITVGVALVALEQSVLAEEVAGSQVGHVLAAAEHLGVTLLDGQQLVREVPLANEMTALFHAHLLREGSDFPEVFLRDLLEQ